MKKRRAPTIADEEEVVYFGRLPDDVIIDIFGRVNDSKFLIQCLLLSKRIASLIRLVSSVSIKIHLPHVEHNPAAAIQGYCHNSSVCLRSKLISPSSQDVEFATLLKLIKWPYSFDELERLYVCKAREALHPFSKVKSAIVEYTKFNSHYLLDTQMMRWMVEYSGGGTVNAGVIKSCAFLGQIDHHTAKGFYSRDGKRIVSWVASLIQTLFTFYPMVAQMAQDHESLGDILVTAGSSRNGWIHAGEDEIVKMRQAGGSAADKLNKMLEEMHMKAKVWYVPVPKESTVFAFVVASGPDNIDQEVKAARRRFWGDCSYWAGQDDEVIRLGIERNMRELVETIPCNFECNWITEFEVTEGKGKLRI